MTCVARCSPCLCTGDQGVEHLSHFVAAANLEELRLILWCNFIGNAGAISLSHLRHAPSLYHLVLDLESNDIQVDGARHLGLLQESRTLCSLTLNLRYNLVGAEGVLVLLSMRPAAVGRVRSASALCLSHLPNASLWNFGSLAKFVTMLRCRMRFSFKIGGGRDIQPRPQIITQSGARGMRSSCRTSVQGQFPFFF